MNNREEVAKSIHIAERLAACEYRLEMFQKSMPREVKEAKIHLETVRQLARKDGLAMEFLPQARMVIKVREERERILQDSFINDVIMATVSERCAGKRQHSLPPFKHPLDNETWKRFLRAVKKGNVRKTMEALATLMGAVSFDLKYNIDLPPVPKYYFPHIKTHRA